MADDPVALLAQYQLFIDAYRNYCRVMDAAFAPGAPNMDAEMWDALEFYDTAFEPLEHRNDTLLDLAIAALKQDNARQYEPHEEVGILSRPPVMTLRERLKQKRALGLT